MSTKQLEGEVAFITGAASGINEAIARRFAAAGASVVVADVDKEGGERVAAEIGGDAVFMEHDVSIEDHWQRAMAAVADRFGKLTILVNGAGINPAGSIADLSYEDWRRTFAVNTDSMFFGCKYGIETMIKTAPGRGNIINLASPTGEHVMPAITAYSASKAAVHALTRAVALHCAEQDTGIRCNAVMPGTVMTQMARRFVDAAPDPETAVKAIEAMQPMKRTVRPEEVAEGALFLVSGAASAITGVILPVDAGFMAL